MAPPAGSVGCQGAGAGKGGGIATVAEAEAQLAHVDGVMMGRAAYGEPAQLLAADPVLFGQEAPAADPFAAAGLFEPYLAARLAEGVRLHAMTRHMLGLFNGRPGARAYRRHLATAGTRPEADLATFREAVALVSRSEPAPIAA